MFWGVSESAFSLVPENVFVLASVFALDCWNFVLLLIFSWQCSLFPFKMWFKGCFMFGCVRVGHCLFQPSRIEGICDVHFSFATLAFVKQLKQNKRFHKVSFILQDATYLSHSEALNRSHHCSPSLPDCDCARVRSTIVCLIEWSSSCPSFSLLSPPPTLSIWKPGDLTFVWTMPALWSLKCSRVAAISISLAPATERKLERVQSGPSNPAHICQSLLDAVAPFGAAPPLKIITFIPGKTWTGATHCFPDKICRRRIFIEGRGASAGTLLDWILFCFF